MQLHSLGDSEETRSYVYVIHAEISSGELKAAEITQAHGDSYLTFATHNAEEGLFQARTPVEKGMGSG